jgi:uncharacterized Zn-finger protein
MGWNETRNSVTCKTIRSQPKTTQEQTIHTNGTTNQLSALTEPEQVLSTVRTTVKNKLQQDVRERILQDSILKQHQKNACLPKLPCKTAHSIQVQLQTIEIHSEILTDPKNIRTDVRNCFKDFYSTKGNKPDVKYDTFSNMPSLDTEGRENATLPSPWQNWPLFSTGGSPGLDELAYEFYKQFWNELGRFLFRVANTSVKQGKLPTSMFYMK